MPAGATDPFSVCSDPCQYFAICDDKNTDDEQQPRADNEEMMNSRFMSLTELLYGDVKLFGPFEDSLRLLIEELGMRRDEGNSNSGNHNHKGRPGQLGGSGGGGSSLGKFRRPVCGLPEWDQF